MLTYYNKELGRMVIELSKENYFCVKAISNECISDNKVYTLPPKEIAYGTIIDRLASYERTGFEPHEVVDKGRYEELKSKYEDKKAHADFLTTITQLKYLIVERKGYIHGNDADHDSIYENDITALETAITMLETCSNFEKQLKQEKETNKHLKEENFSQSVSILRLETELQRVKKENERLRNFDVSAMIESFINNMPTIIQKVVDNIPQAIELAIQKRVEEIAKQEGAKE